MFSSETPEQAVYFFAGNSVFNGEEDCFLTTTRRGSVGSKTHGWSYDDEGHFKKAGWS